MRYTAVRYTPIIFISGGGHINDMKNPKDEPVFKKPTPLLRKIIDFMHDGSGE